MSYHLTELVQVVDLSMEDINLVVLYMPYLLSYLWFKCRYKCKWVFVYKYDVT